VSSPSHAPLVLVVEDDAELRRMLGTAITARGYRVALAGNGREAIACVHAEVPRLIVLDYWMPVLDGAGFMQELKQMMPQRPPVILLTAAQDKPDLARALGVDVYVEKPVAMGRLVKLIEVTLRAAPAVDVAPRDRRAGVRVPRRRPAWVHLPGESAPRAAATIDLSEGGMALELGERTELPIDAEMGVAVQLAEGRLELSGRVRNVSDRRVGLCFAALDQGARRALQRLMAEAE
jgi:CheY-like chemotaxis protein